ncbi:hypothetical protein TNCV_114151 [Trichonephila clavipes]|nr:hypothetical protein TNCV_114151 [Trichonephila clavipes]
METVNAQRYLTLLRETVVPCLIQRDQISNVTFMQDGATSHTANPVKAFLIQTFGEDRIVKQRVQGKAAFGLWHAGHVPWALKKWEHKKMEDEKREKIKTYAIVPHSAT